MFIFFVPSSELTKNSKNYYKFPATELNLFSDCPMRAVKVEAGDLILWDSRTVHEGLQPQEGSTANTRGAVYVSYNKASLATPDDIKTKKKAFDELTSTTHWASHPVKLQAKKPNAWGGKTLPKIKDIYKITPYA